MIRRDYKLKSEIKKHVDEITKKMYYDVRNLTNQIRGISAKVSRLENLSHKPREFVRCNECKNKIKELDK